MRSLVLGAAALALLLPLTVAAAGSMERPVPAPSTAGKPSSVATERTQVALVAQTRPAAQRSGTSVSLPSKRAWIASTERIMRGSVPALRARVAAARPKEKLALNLDIDNTSLATRYDRGKPIAATLRLARAADRLGVAVFFNTARPRKAVPAAAASLRRAGFPIDGVCSRVPGMTLVQGKQYCRASFAAAGYKIVANVGNRPTDFVGGGFERRYKLRSYGGRLT